MSDRRYATPAAFKQALEQRLKAASGSGTDLARRRQLVVFERFLARIVRQFGDAAVLKGGLVLEQRIARARATRDVDLRVTGSLDEVLLGLQAAGRLDVDDWMRFEVQRDPRQPAIRGEGIRYEGQRFRAECRLAGKIYGRPFGVDVAAGDPLIGAPDLVPGKDVLAFADVAPPTVPLYPVASHVAEKLHAYTMPRDRPNSRVKDLPDIALLATAGRLEAAELREALALTFTYRGTHPLPASVPVPPSRFTTWVTRALETPCARAMAARLA